MEKSDKQPKEEIENPFKGRKYTRAVGRRKSSIAVAQLYTRGKGAFVVNKKDLKSFFSHNTYVDIAHSSIEESDKTYDVNVRVRGGGIKGQAEAIRLAVARALIKHNEDLRPILRQKGYIKVDRRVKERKKPGLKRARRAPQWSKR